MTIKVFCTLSAMNFALFSFGQQNEKPCSCCTEMHEQFNFWLGDWTVTDTAETLLGTNTIARIQDGCVLQEIWNGAKGSTGTSYSYFNKKDSTWNQTWIDNSGGSLVLKGRFENGSMVLRTELLSGKKGNEYYHEISWTPQENGSVTQIWLIKDPNGKTLQTAFEGIYNKAN